jgi:hypothetical protein
MHKTLTTLTLVMGLLGCGLVSIQTVYEEIRTQEKTKAVGTGAAPSSTLPRDDRYEKERGQLALELRS